MGLVVIEFHDDAGKLTSSIPSQRQRLAAYRIASGDPAKSGTHEFANRSNGTASPAREIRAVAGNSAGRNAAIRHTWT